MRILFVLLWLMILLSPSVAFGCPFCSVDGPATTMFLLSFFGPGMLSVLFIFLWAMLSGRFKDVESPKHRILELDKSTKIKPETMD